MPMLRHKQFFFFHLLILITLCHTYLQMAKLAKLHPGKILQSYSKISQDLTRSSLWQCF